MDRSVHAIPKSKPNDIYEIQTNGNCINIYPQENCVGQFVRVQTGLNYIYVGNLVGNRLDKNIVVDHEKVIVGSIGPCFEKCDPQNLVGMRKDLSTSVTLHDELYYPGEKRMRIKVMPICDNKLIRLPCGIFQDPIIHSQSLGCSASKFRH